MYPLFLQTDRSRSVAVRYFRLYAPWVEVVARVTGGYYGFACRDDYRLWRKQK